MPGPVSDSFDPEFGSREAASEIVGQLDEVYDRVSEILNGRQPIYIGNLVNMVFPTPSPATLTEKEWRLIRFALERSMDSI